ncbi:hypothetical protein ACE1CD_20910 [Aerosakkonema sp. BLCC-F183]|uniref:hypothetical protein n=1 Tax=Aerosakkonema sp. BLCC-F183 TaxID=3342834 RepID=UPI0035B774A9
MSPESSSKFPTAFFSNQLPERLNAELTLADRLGIKPLKVAEPGFDDTINEGTIKWAVTTENQLLVIPKFVGSQEISHTALTLGQPVLAAGEAEIVGSNGEYYLLEITNYSGHFIPTPDSLEIGIEAFRRQGLDPTNAIVKYYGGR